LVGEILVKYHPGANNAIIDLIENEGAEAIVPDLMSFLLYNAFNLDFKNKYISGKWIDKLLGNAAIKGMEFYRSEMIRALAKSQRFEKPHNISKMAQNASKILSIGNQTGEGWLLTAEMVELIRSGVGNIICMQPFACLPNHVTGKGMMKEIRRQYPVANIIAVDYDPGASEVNQLNRIRLMLTSAFKALGNSKEGTA